MAKGTSLTSLENLVTLSVGSGWVKVIRSGNIGFHSRRMPIA